MNRILRLARAEFAPLVALVVAAFGTLAFIGLADGLTDGEGRDFDLYILHALRPWPDQPDRPWGPWWLHEAMADITSLGGISVLGLFAILAVSLLLMQKNRLGALLLVVGLAGGVMLSEGLKALFERDRPPEAYQVVDTLNASFPSGHALLATVFYLSVGVMLTRAFARRRLKIFALCAAMLVVVLVGLSRVYLGAHWMTDVLAGWCVGGAFAMVLWLVSQALERLAWTDRPKSNGGARPRRG